MLLSCSSILNIVSKIDNYHPISFILPICLETFIKRVHKGKLCKNLE